MYFANWILKYLSKPISRVYVQLGTCRPGVMKKAVTNLFNAKVFNAICLDSWKQRELIFKLNTYFFSEGEASTQCTMLLGASREYCTYYLWLDKLTTEIQRVAFFNGLEAFWHINFPEFL